jgi:glycosyltransferase involved in cell wall biosynthesis
VRGGVESAFSNLLSGLSRTEGVEPYAVTFVPGLARPARGSHEGVRTLYLPGARRLGNLTFHLRERRRLSAALSEIRPEVVHAQDALRYGYVCLKAGRRLPVLVSIHGIVREAQRHETGIRARGQVRIAGVALERYCVRTARFLVTPTPYAQEYFGGEISGRVWDVPNPIADRFFAVRAAPERGAILYAGSLAPLKRIHDLVAAMPRVLASVPEAHLRLAGRAPDAAYASTLTAGARASGLADRITLLGALSPEEMVDEYRRASVLVLPSAQETSPMVVGEAMAAGVPVVATRVGGVPFLVDDGVTGHLVDVGDVEALARRVGEILSDPERATALGGAGRATAEVRFRADAVAARVRTVYAEILGAASGR